MTIDDYIKLIGPNFIGLWTWRGRVKRRRARRWVTSYLDLQGEHEETHLRSTPIASLRECAKNLGRKK